jgi:hypothetical protein
MTTLWRAFYNVSYPKLWGIETSDPAAIEAGLEIVVAPYMPEHAAKDIAEAWNAKAAIPDNIAEIVERELMKWRDRAAAAEAVLEFIAIGYANQDINHEDFRVSVYKAALETLEASAVPNGDRK